MPEIEKSVTVCAGSEPLGTERLTLRRLPGGGLGVLRRGQVFARQPGGAIDIASRFDVPAACERLADSAPEAAALWTVSTDDPPLLLVHGDEMARDAALAALQNAGASVRASGPYLAGSQSPEAAPDWFIVPEGLSRSDLQTLLAPALAVAPAPPLSDTERLAAAAERETLLRHALELLRQDARAAAETITGLAARLHDTETAWAEEGAARAAAEQLVEAARRAAPPTSAPALPTSSARRAAEELADAVAALLPRLTLLGGSREALAFGYRSRSAVLRALRELHERPDEVLAGWKIIRRAGSWRERHISNGQDDSGRLYARRGSAGAVEVLLSDKASQERDIVWLAKQ
jgi:hypothetical protein